MRVRVSGVSIPWIVLESVNSVLDRGRIEPKNAIVTSEDRAIAVRFSRRAGGKGRAGREYQPGDGRGRERRIESILTIRNVTSRSVVADEDVQVVTVLFGAKIEGRKIGIYSAEEDHGVPCFRLEVAVDSFDIEVCDVAEQASETV